MANSRGIARPAIASTARKTELLCSSADRGGDRPGRKVKPPDHIPHIASLISPQNQPPFDWEVVGESRGLIHGNAGPEIPLLPQP